MLEELSRTSNVQVQELDEEDSGLFSIENFETVNNLVSLEK